MGMSRFISLVLLLAMLCLAVAVQAAPLSQIARLTRAGSGAVKVELTQGSAAEVRTGILKALPRARVQVLADKTLKVRGATLAALGRVEIDLGEADADSRAAIAEGALALDAPDGSASIRAGQPDQAVAEVIEPTQFIGRVVEVKRTAWPRTRITVTIEKPATEPKYADACKEGATVTVLPIFNGVNMAQRMNFQNAGANYLLPGDRVKLTIYQLRSGLVLVKGVERLP